MTIQSRRLDQSGFTILETLISSGILTIAIIGANMQYVSQLQAEAGVKQQMQNRSVLNQVTTLVTNSPALFPHAFRQLDHSPALYVACFNPDGTAMANTIPGSGVATFVAVYYGLSWSDFANPIVAPGAPATVCDTKRGGFEVHVAWVDTYSYPPSELDPYRGSAQVTAIILPAPGMHYTPASRVTRAYVFEI